METRFTKKELTLIERALEYYALAKKNDGNNEQLAYEVRSVAFKDSKQAAALLRKVGVPA